MAQATLHSAMSRAAASRRSRICQAAHGISRSPSPPTAIWPWSLATARLHPMARSICTTLPPQPSRHWAHPPPAGDPTNIAGMTARRFGRGDRHGRSASTRSGPASCTTQTAGTRFIRSWAVPASISPAGRSNNIGGMSPTARESGARPAQRQYGRVRRRVPRRLPRCLRRVAAGAVDRRFVFEQRYDHGGRLRSSPCSPMAPITRSRMRGQRTRRAASTASSAAPTLGIRSRTRSR